MGVYGRGGLMNFAIYSARLFRHIVPKKAALAICKLLSKDPVFWYAVLDPMYVPIRENYYEREIRELFDRFSLENVVRLDSHWGPYAYGRWMRGEGYLRYAAEKPGV